MPAERQSAPPTDVQGSFRSRIWRGPEPDRLHRLLLTACCAPEAVAMAAWERWLRECRFDDEDPSSFELASLAVGRLGALAGEGSEATRCRGWSRRAWFLSGLAADAAERLEEAAASRGLRLVAVGDLASFRAGIRFAGRPFPVRSVELHVPGAGVSELRQLYAAAMQGPAADAIRTRRLNLIVRSNSSHADVTSAAGRIVWLAARNWCRFPPGRLRWILEIVATADSAGGSAADFPLRVVEEARRNGTIATVREAVGWIDSEGFGNERVAAIHNAIRKESPPLTSRLRLWHARHQLGLGLRARFSRWLHPAR